MSRTPEEQNQARRSTWTSVWVNLLLATAQVVIGYLARSQALIADGFHSLSDLLADGVVLWAARHSSQAPDENHQYGHARFETAAALAIGVLLLVTGCGMIWAAGVKLHEGSGMEPVHPVALLVALLTLVAKEGLFHYMRRIGERLKSSMLIANAWHARADAASSLVVALGIGANLLGYHSMDSVAAIIVGFMIGKAGWDFATDAFHSLTDHALDPDEIQRIRHTIEMVDGVRGIHALRTRRMGDWAVIEMHVEVDSQLSVSEGHYIAEKVSAEVRATHRVAECTVHIDPAHADQTESLLRLPTRTQVQAWLQAEAPAPLRLQLHYLDAGLEVEVEVATALGDTECAALRQRLQTCLARHVPGSRLRLRCSAPEA